MVLIVDDDADTRDMLSVLLSRRRITVLVAEDRETALRILHGSERPSCIVLDLNMPGMSAQEFIERARALASGIGIVLISGSGEVEQRARELGLTCYCSKPIYDFEKFFKLIENCRMMCMMERWK